MLVTKTIEIDMGHRVPNHKSKCRFLHGHRYKIECGVDDKVITEQGKSNEGMVIDFGDLKKILVEQISDGFDHKMVLSFWDRVREFFTNREMEASGIITVDFIPTAENLAIYWYNLIKPELAKQNIKIKFIKVWETPNSTAIYEES